MHAVVTRPHVADRLRSLLEEFMSGAARDAGGLAGPTRGNGPSDPESIQRLLIDDPEALLGVEMSPERARVARELAAVTAAMAGYRRVRSRRGRQQAPRGPHGARRGVAP